ncbi:MAG: sel1 repeat family protein [Hyphomicrobium sp.]|nr:sel1 repeat family protein [Hyphomicrobium sp.]MBN9264171.1 sel1 repeat family protein [Hyphomicrobium sp.]MBN9278291.1 sel1 repeat family protein [Hyphomicrobium sp.]
MPRRLAFAALAATALLMGGVHHLGLPGQAQAQQQEFFLNVAPVMLAEPASRSPLPIQVGPQDALMRNSFVRIRGLPATATLTEGHAISAGAWAIPLAGLASLGIVLPVGLQQGRWDVVVALVTIEGKVLTEAKTALVVGPVQLIAPSQQQAQAKQAPSVVANLARPIEPVPQPEPQSSPERERALGLHAKGKELLGLGNVQPARALFRRAAESGLAESALALAGTYDPHELAKLRVVGLQPDVAAARQWYTKARELGAPEAAERLKRLEAR